MSTGFAPGEMTVVTIDGQEHRAMRDCADAWLVGDIEDDRVFFDRDGLVTGVHRLYVLDTRSDRRVQALADALRQPLEVVRRAVLATFPRPDEPTGIGAIAQDGGGSVWSRRADGRWHCLTGDPAVEDLVEWKHFDQVHVLSEGVPA